MDSLERLQGLHVDLVSFIEARLANINRLSQELEDSIQDFRNLLDKPSTAAGERDAYNKGNEMSTISMLSSLTCRQEN